MAGLPFAGAKDVSLLQRQQQATDRLAQKNTRSSFSGATPGEKSEPELAAACQQFESLLLNFMLREMRATVPESPLFPKSMAQDIFTEMLDERLAGEMADNGGIGLARMIFNQLKQR